MMILVVVAVGFSVIGLYLLAGYLIVDYFLPSKYGIADRLALGFSLITAIVIITGYGLSSAYAFNSIAVGAEFLLLVIASLILGYKKNRFQGVVRIVQLLRGTAEARVVFACVMSTFALCMLYEADSILPQAWDRGIHFTEFLDLLTDGHIGDQYPGTTYNNFYPQGHNLVLSFVTMLVTGLVGLDQGAILTDLTPYGPPFEMTWAFINSMWPLLGYCISRAATDDRKTAMCCCVLVLFAAGFEFSRLGSIGTSLGYLMVMAFVLLLLKEETSKTRTIPVTGLSILVVASVPLIHVIPPVYLAAYVALYVLLSLSRRNEMRRNSVHCMLIAVAGLFLAGAILLVFASSLLTGMLEETWRKGSSGSSPGQGIDLLSAWLAYMTNQTNGLLFGLDMTIVPLLMIGSTLARKWRSTFGFRVMILTGIMFTLVPVVTFPRAVYYLLIPLAAIGGEGLHTLAQKASRIRIKTANRLGQYSIPVLVISLFIVPAFVSQVYVAANPGPWREHSELDEDLWHTHGLSDWFRDNVEADAIVTFPSSGAMGRLFEILVDNRVYFADRRYTDLPQYVDIASIYDSEGKDWETRLGLIALYNISVIIAAFTYQLANLTVLVSAFPTLVTVSLYEQYTVIVLTPESMKTQ